MILDLIDTLADCLDRESARRIIKMNLDQHVQRRLDELTVKEKQGQLASDEYARLVLLTAFGHFLSALQKSARAILRRPAKSNRS